MEKNCNSPLRKKQKYTGMSFKDIESHLFHLAEIKRQCLTLIRDLYEFELAHKTKYWQNVEIDSHSDTENELQKMSEDLLLQNKNQEERYEMLRSKNERNALLMKILKKKETCCISKIVDKI